MMKIDTLTVLTELERLRRRLDEMADREVRRQRMLGDLLYNLDTENMPAVKKLIEQYRTESGESVAAVSAAVSETGASVSALAERQTAVESTAARAEAAATDNAASILNLASRTGQTESGLAALSLRTEENETAITALAQQENGTQESIAALESRADDAQAEIYAFADWMDYAQGEISSIASLELVAEEANAKASLFATLSNGSVEADGAAILAAVNGDGSSIKLSADKIDFNGVGSFVKSEDLAAGSTTINGGCIEAHSLSVDALSLDSNGQIHFSDLGSISFSDPDSGSTGSINLSSNEYGSPQFVINASEILLLGNAEVSGYLTNYGSEVLTAETLYNYLPASFEYYDIMMEEVRDNSRRLELLENELHPPV